MEQGGTTACSCTTPLIDDTTTVIDGGHITTGSIDANLITTGTMRAERIKGGTLTLGGDNNTNGSLSILDANGDEVGRWDKDSIYVKNGDIYQEQYISAQYGTAWLRMNATTIAGGYTGFGNSAEVDLQNTIKPVGEDIRWPNATLSNDGAVTLMAYDLPETDIEGRIIFISGQSNTDIGIDVGYWINQGQTYTSRAAFTGYIGNQFYIHGIAVV